jgi:hypothetical protein
MIARLKATRDAETKSEVAGMYMKGVIHYIDLNSTQRTLRSVEA